MKPTFKQSLFQNPILTLALLALPTAAGEVATPVREFTLETGAPPPLRMPTAVAVGSSGDVFVLDGAHNRIVAFHSDGAVAGILDKFSDQVLNQPVGLKITADGRLWIADSGNGRVLIARPDGTIEQQIDLPPADTGRRPDPTDLAPSPDGAAAWIVDNDNDRLLRFDLRAGTWQLIGRRGAALGQFEYPFSVAIAPNGDVIVTDVINARGQLLSPTGEPLARIGSYGIELGQFHRPGGLAIDPTGQIWIADSVIGVIQIFRTDGSLVDVLRDASGAPFRLESPLGLCFDQAGALYVAETRANRVRKFTIEHTSVAPPAAPPPARSAAIGQQAQACTMCHVEWMPQFADGRDSGLMPRPVAPPNDPLVSRGETCLSCHDGTVVDSRRRVWDEHGHQTGITPPDTMTVPQHLPLIDGRLACRTCHSAHGRDVPQNDFRRAVFLRVPNDASQLCMSCHVDKTRGPRFGTHPTGGMPWPIPDALIEAGAKKGPNPRELTCQVCHTPHGAKNDHLLVLGTTSNQLCVTCHDQIRPGMFRDGAHAEHPLTTKVSSEQAAAVRELGTKLGPDDQLICLSCHKLHHGHGERFLLADDLADGQMCLRCHSARREMLGSSHDLRTNFPAERNRLGQTAADGGPCSSCHLFHRYARQTAPGPGDASGHCLSCHQPGQCAQNKLLGGVNHPAVNCTECHNPHETRFGDFLKSTPEELCTTCHIDQTHLIGGPHDASKAPETWCPPGDHAGDRCLACHTPHGDAARGLLRFEPAAGAPARDATCLACHPDAAPDSDFARALLHPVAVGDAAPTGNLTLVSHGDHSAGLGCVTCHDPHSGGNGTRALLRSERLDGVDLCLRCHTEMQPILTSAHSPTVLAEHSYPAAACLPCHQVHGDARTVESKHLWPCALLARDAEPLNGSDGHAQTGDRLCLECHQREGPADSPACASHPNVSMFNPAPDGAGLPLFNERGERDSYGMIACRTCHVPHGRPAADLPPDASRTPEALARQLHLREFEPPNVCTNCHGVDALRRYLYFHDQARRGGDLSLTGSR